MYIAVANHIIKILPFAEAYKNNCVYRQYNFTSMYIKLNGVKCNCNVLRRQVYNAIKELINNT